jgi:hypothetical protein
MNTKKLVKPLVITVSAIAGLLVTKEALEYYVIRGLRIGK